MAFFFMQAVFQVEGQGEIERVQLRFDVVLEDEVVFRITGGRVFVPGAAEIADLGPEPHAELGGQVST